MHAFDQEKKKKENTILAKKKKKEKNMILNKEKERSLQRKKQVYHTYKSNPSYKRETVNDVYEGRKETKLELKLKPR